MSYRSRFESALSRYGKDVPLTAGQSQRTIKGVFNEMSPAIMNMYFESSEAMLLTRPAILGIVSGVEEVSINNTLVYNGRTLTVKKIGTHYIHNEPVGKTLLLD